MGKTTPSSYSCCSALALAAASLAESQGRRPLEVEEEEKLEAEALEELKGGFLLIRAAVAATCSSLGLMLRATSRQARASSCLPRAMKHIPAPAAQLRAERFCFEGGGRRE